MRNSVALLCVFFTLLGLVPGASASAMGDPDCEAAVLWMLAFGGPCVLFSIVGYKLWEWYSGTWLQLLAFAVVNVALYKITGLMAFDWAHDRYHWIWNRGATVKSRESRSIATAPGGSAER